MIRWSRRAAPDRPARRNAADTASARGKKSVRVLIDHLGGQRGESEVEMRLGHEMDARDGRPLIGSQRSALGCVFVVNARQTLRRRAMDVRLRIPIERGQDIGEHLVRVGGQRRCAEIDGGGDRMFEMIDGLAAPVRATE